MQNTENKFKHDGLWYVSKNTIDGTAKCDGCAWYCNRKMCLAAPDCFAEDRKDNRNVIFVRSDVDNLGDEE